MILKTGNFSVPAEMRRSMKQPRLAAAESSKPDLQPPEKRDRRSLCGMSTVSSSEVDSVERSCRPEERLDAGRIHSLRYSVEIVVRQPHTAGTGSAQGLLASVAPEAVESCEQICSPRRPASLRHLARTENEFTDNKCTQQSYQRWTCQRVAHRTYLA